MVILVIVCFLFFKIVLEFLSSLYKNIHLFFRKILNYEPHNGNKNRIEKDGLNFKNICKK